MVVVVVVVVVVVFERVVSVVEPLPSALSATPSLVFAAVVVEGVSVVVMFIGSLMMILPFCFKISGNVGSLAATRSECLAAFDEHHITIILCFRDCDGGVVMISIVFTFRSELYEVECVVLLWVIVQPLWICFAHFVRLPTI